MMQISHVRPKRPSIDRVPAPLDLATAESVEELRVSLNTLHAIKRTMRGRLSAARRDALSSDHDACVNRVVRARKALDVMLLEDA